MIYHIDIDVLSGLREDGYTDQEGFDSCIFDEKRIDAIRALVRQLLKPIRQYPHKNSAASSSLKSLLERYAGKNNVPVIEGYIRQGECIYAMFLEGYLLKRAKNGQSAYISVSKQSYSKLETLVNPSIYDLMKQRGRSY